MGTKNSKNNNIYTAPEIQKHTPQITNKPIYTMGIWRDTFLHIVVWNSYLQIFENPYFNIDDKPQKPLKPMIQWLPVNNLENEQYTKIIRECDIFPIPTNFCMIYDSKTAKRNIFIRIIILDKIISRRVHAKLPKIVSLHDIDYYSHTYDSIWINNYDITIDPVITTLWNDFTTMLTNLKKPTYRSTHSIDRTILAPYLNSDFISRPCPTPESCIKCDNITKLDNRSVFEIFRLFDRIKNYKLNNTFEDNRNIIISPLNISIIVHKLHDDPNSEAPSEDPSEAHLENPSEAHLEDPSDAPPGEDTSDAKPDAEPDAKPIAKSSGSRVVSVSGKTVVIKKRRKLTPEETIQYREKKMRNLEFSSYIAKSLIDMI